MSSSQNANRSFPYMSSSASSSSSAVAGGGAVVAGAAVAAYAHVSDENDPPAGSVVAVRRTAAAAAARDDSRTKRLSSSSHVHSYPVTPTVVHGHTFSLSSRYVLKDAKVLGKGSFGVVVTALDSLTGRTVAVKRIRPYANDDWDAKHTLREIRLLNLLGKHPNVSEKYSYDKMILIFIFILICMYI